MRSQTSSRSRMRARPPCRPTLYRFSGAFRDRFPAGARPASASSVRSGFPKKNAMPTATPRALALHLLDDRFLVTRFLTRFAEKIWMIDDITRADEDPAGLGVELYQGDLAGCRARLRELLGRKK